MDYQKRFYKYNSNYINVPLLLPFLLCILMGNNNNINNPWSFGLAASLSNNNNTNSSNVLSRTIFSFGDSLLDAGNNHFNKNCSSQADFPPYGSTFFHRPTGRFTNGRTVVDFISEYIGIDLQKPFLEAQMAVSNGTWKAYPSNGINFASAGSGVLGDTGSIFKPEVFIQTMLTEVGKLVEQLYKHGARRIGLLSLGPVGCVPARVLIGGPTKKCYGKMNKMVKDYNKGFKNVSEACCGEGVLRGEVQCGREGYKICEKPEEYLFWDYFHPTEHAYKIISKALWTGSTLRIRPVNIKTLAYMTL
ncbi:hypothetical protein G4B88_005878 [Cannabis sativa]|uniref:Uncharacterized protein n=1 Tax=Cannabis sativa TaxID=3483 RepID=A0A7J6IA68_CANSA|nr:hypothetical protein G4B88_005878 [Cannabis sativa]